MKIVKFFTFQIVFSFFFFSFWLANKRHSLIRAKMKHLSALNLHKKICGIRHLESWPTVDMVIESDVPDHSNSIFTWLNKIFLLHFVADCIWLSIVDALLQQTFSDELCCKLCVRHRESCFERKWREKKYGKSKPIEIIKENNLSAQHQVQRL